MFVVACIIAVGVILATINIQPLADITKSLESMPDFFSIADTQASSNPVRINPDEPIVLPRNDCIVYEGTQLRYIKSEWQCREYFAEVANDKNWCFAGMFDAISADMFNQSSYRSYATIAKYVYC